MATMAKCFAPTLGPVPLQQHHFLSSKHSTFPFQTRTNFHHSKPFHQLNIATLKRSLLPQITAQTSLDYVPNAKFYKIEAILRPWRITKVSAALMKVGIRGVTVSDVRGFGAQGGSAERHAGSEFSEDKFVSKVKMEIVVSKDQVARTGEIGDGKIFVLPVADIIRVRTGERGEEAERMSGGRHEMFNSKAN